MGKNATTYCFLTGFGTKGTMNPHHRPSIGDGHDLPVPGFIAGGPNAGQQDKHVTYLSSLPAKSYMDHESSYASNEVAINWNSPVAQLLASLDHVLAPKSRK